MSDEALGIVQTEAKLVKTQPVETRVRAESHGIVPPDGSLFIIPFCFAILWAIVTFPFFRELPKASSGSRILLKGSKIPCRNCKFYSKNSYLKCAVHPTIAATEDAINCSDFCSRE